MSSIYLYLSLYRSSFDDLSFSPLAAVVFARFSSGVALRDEGFSGVALRLGGPRPSLPAAGAFGCIGKDPGGKPCRDGPAVLLQ
jgi:hypothetical protein